MLAQTFVDASFEKLLRREFLSLRSPIRALIGCGGLILAFVGLGVAVGFYLQRDAEPYLARRHGELVAAELEDRGQLDDRGALADDSLPAPGARRWSVEYWNLTSSSGLRCELALRLPAARESATPLPLIVLVGGHRTGREAVHLMPDDDRFAVAALSYPFEGESKLKGARAVAALPRVRRALLDMVPCIALAVDHLEMQPRIDPERVELVGVSLGAPIAVVVGALDTRFRRVWSVHGGGDLPRMIEHNLVGKVGPPLRGPLAGLGGWIVAPLDPERFAERISPRPLVMINAADDERIPRACVESLFAAAEEPKELLWVSGRHVGPRRAETLESLLEIVLPRIAEPLP